MIVILLLHSSSGDVTSDPRCHILTNFDQHEEEDAVNGYHAEDDTKIHPFRSMNVNLVHIFQDVLSRYLRKIQSLVVKKQALEIILVLSLKSLNCFSY